ncbi:MAG: hypothetical protein IJV58_05040 [Oscillospiraceae bacterium]|nr:hypothetical protein [Oscillospiraceae bacterium]
MYAEYSYYTGSFGGTLVPEDDWDRAAGSASDWMDAATFGRLTAGVPEEWETQVKRCCCEMAEQVYSLVLSSADTDVGSSALASEQIGEYSVSYRSPADRASALLDGSTAGLEDVLRSIVRRYLGRTGLLYRGVI